MSPSHDVLSDVLEIIRDMLCCPPSAVHADAWFFADLGLSSIDLIVLGDRLEEHYATPLRFADSLSEVARAGVEDVTLGQLASLVELRLQQPNVGG
jgi:acyl carrier protein